MDAAKLANKNISTTDEIAPSSTKNISLVQSILYELAPGAAQGAVGAMIGHPFDTIKTRTQDAAFFAKNANQTTTSSATATTTSPSMLRVTLDTYKNHGGIKAFYRGVTIPIFVKSAQRSLQYALWDILKAEPFNLGAFSSGAIVGAVGTVVVGCPAHVVKIHSQVSGKHLNALQTTIALFKSDRGFFKSFFAGLPANIAKDTVFASTYLGMYDTYKKKIRPGCSAAEASFCASLVSWSIFLPLDTIKTVLQSPHYLSNAKSCNDACQNQTSLLKKASNFVKQQGVVAVLKKGWSGLLPALLRAGPANAAAMTSYEYVKQWSAKQKLEMKK